MRVSVIAVVLALGLGGCANPVDDLLSGRYSETEATSPDPELVGTWTGSMSSYLVTLRIREDGTGLYCYSWNEKHALNRLKYDGERLVFQDGARAEVISASSDKLVLRPSYEHADESVLRGDEMLGEASPYCVSALR